MATQETQNAQDRTDGLGQANAGSDGSADEGAKGWNVTSNLIIIGAFASFAVAFVGFVIRHEAVLVAGGAALALVSFIWAVAATIALWRLSKDWLRVTARRLFRHDAASE